MLLALFQGPANASGPSETLDAMRRAAEQARADLLIMPELFLTGYNIGPEALRAAAERQDGPSAQAAAQIARQSGTALLYGYPERDGDAVYNAALLIGADGKTLANYRKIHLFGDLERGVFTPGSEPCVIAEVGEMKVGVLVCYDVEFPEMVRGLALRGADLVAVPTALMQPYDFVADVLVRARAYESQVFLAYANRTGTEGALTYVGASCIVAPDGAVLARAGAGAQIIASELDMAALRQSRLELPYLSDRLPAHYAALAAAPAAGA